MSSLLHVPLRGHTEPLPGIGLHPIEFHDGKGYYYFTKDHSVSFDKRTLKCVKEHCSVTAQMEPVLGLLIDSETHSHAADLSYRDKCVLLHIIRERFLYETLPADVILQEVLTSFLGGSRNKDDERGEPCDDINEIVEEDQFSLKEEESEERLQTVDSEHEPQDIEHLGSSDGNSSFEVVVKEEPADESDNTLSEVQNHTKFRSSQKRKLQNIDNDVPDLQVPKKSKTLKSSLVRTAPEELNLPSSHADFQEDCSNLREVLECVQFENIYLVDTTNGSKSNTSCNRIQLPSNLNTVNSSETISEVTNQNHLEINSTFSLPSKSAERNDFHFCNQPLERSLSLGKTNFSGSATVNSTNGKMEPNQTLPGNIKKTKNILLSENCLIENSKLPDSRISASLSNLTDQNSVLVAKLTNTKTKRVWDKKYSCTFCGKLVSKIPRHLEQKHSMEEEVKSIKQLKPGDPNRLMILNKLRDTGNFIHNSKVLESNKGIILPRRRKGGQVDPSEYIPCPHCHKFMARKNFRKHFDSCVGSKTQSQIPYRSFLSQAEHLLPLTDHGKCKDIFTNVILHEMKKDEVYHQIVSDEVIMEYGTELVGKFINKYDDIENRQKRLIKINIQEIAKFFIEAKKVTKLFAQKESESGKKVQSKQLVSLVDLFKDANYSGIVVEAAQNLYQLGSATKTMNKHKYLQRIGNEIKRCAVICLKIAIRNNESHSKEIKEFLCFIEKRNWFSKLKLDSSRSEK